MDILRRFTPTTKYAAPMFVLLLSALLLSSCAVEGLRLQGRNNPRDLAYPPVIKNVYINTTSTPLTEDTRLESNSDELIIEFSMAMDQQSTEAALLLQDSSDPPVAYEPDLSWPEIHALHIAAPDGGWPVDRKIELVVLKRAENAVGKSMTATFDTFFLTAE